MFSAVDVAMSNFLCENRKEKGNYSSKEAFCNVCIMYMCIKIDILVLGFFLLHCYIQMSSIKRLIYLN